MPILIPGAAELKHFLDIFIGTTSGQTVIDSCPFKPKIVYFMARAIDGVQVARCWGFDNGVGRRCVYVEGDTNYVSGQSSWSVYIWRNVSNYARGLITSMDPNGFTIDWSGLGDVYLECVFVCLG